MDVTAHQLHDAAAAKVPENHGMAKFVSEYRLDFIFI